MRSDARVLSKEEEDLAFEMAIMGQSLTNIAEVLRFASFSTFYQYRLRNPLFSKSINDARDASCDVIEDRILSVVRDSESPHHARVQLDALKAALAFKNPQRYGNKMDINLTQTVDIGGSLSRMQERLDATYRDVTPALTAANTNDSNDLW